MKYSIVIPAYNEEESIHELYEKIKTVMDKIGDYEIIFVNDGSTDSTLLKIKELMKSDPKVRVVSFRKNMGKSAALTVGFRECKGKYIITMDADLQDDPAEIPKMIKKLNEGYDLVSGWKQSRQDPIDKTIPSKVFNFIVSFLSGVKFHDFNCGFKIYRKQVVDSIEIYGQLYRFIPVLASEQGFRATELPVKHNKRKYGKSKYTWKRVFAGILDIITITFLIKFGQRPLHLFGFIGGIVTLIGFSALLYLTILHYFFHQTVGDRPLLIMGAVLFISGLEMVFTGLLAEMITKSSYATMKYPIVVED